jgi:hypothetical protein
MSSENLFLEIPLAEMKRTLDRQVDGLDTIKATVRSVLSAGSLIVSLVAALQLVTAKIDPKWFWLYKDGIVLAAVLYVALIITCILALWPTTVVGPIKPDWDILTTAFKGLSEKEAFLEQLSSILNAIDLNRPIVNRYKYLQMIALALLPALVLVLLLLAFIPRV